MRRVGKLFKRGRNQAVRLPAASRFDGDEVSVLEDPMTCDVILSKESGSWEDFFKLTEGFEALEDFMTDHVSEPPQERDLF